MNLTPKIMAYWVFIFLTVYIVDIIGLLQKFHIDERSLFFGIVTGALLVKLAPKNEMPVSSSDKNEQDNAKT